MDCKLVFENAKHSHVDYVNVHNVGVFFPRFFDETEDYYNRITSEHEFQTLGMGNREGVAFRKGIYLTRVEENGDELYFKLLRCSTNLDGPTDNFRQTDHEIVSKVEEMRNLFFKDSAPLNHVLAQTYHNQPTRKAKIAKHSDKTKDMPSNAIMAFCTFYDFSNVKDVKNVKDNTLKSVDDDVVYGSKQISVLTKLRFKLKPDVKDPNLVHNFEITLSPNSVFMMSLLTNRLYTHEIIPSSLPSELLPTRLGYVIRSSDTNAVHTNGQTFILEGDQNIPLAPNATKEDMKRLTHIYYTENATSETVSYKGFYFSLNQGDYLAPLP